MTAYLVSKDGKYTKHEIDPMRVPCHVSPSDHRLTWTRPCARALAGITRGGATVPIRVQTIKGVEYAFFAAAAGSYVASYTGTAPPPDTPVAPQVVASIIDLVFEWSDLPNKQLIVQRIRQATGAVDPDEGETPEQAAVRELMEETGTDKAAILFEHPEWFYYDLPQDLIDRPDIERVALAQRLDVQAAKTATAQTAPAGTPAAHASSLLALPAGDSIVFPDDRVLFDLRCKVDG